MFVHENKAAIHRAAHFANAARRFAADARVLRCKAAVHVENKSDIDFWSQVLNHFRPQDSFHFISGSRNEFGHETSGVTQCLKYFDYLNPHFFICIDSDYRYLLRERRINVRHFVLQTYTYSFENHLCYAGGLDEVCSHVTNLENDLFDFRAFLKGFSNILYPLFIWHLYFQNTDPFLFTSSEFNSYVVLPNTRALPLVQDNGARALHEIGKRVACKLNMLEKDYPAVNLDKVKEKYLKLGVTPDNVYLYIRGHNLYDMVTLMCKEVCKALIRAEKRNKEVTRAMIGELYRNRNSLDSRLRRNLKFGAYLPIQRIEEDILHFFHDN